MMTQKTKIIIYGTEVGIAIGLLLSSAVVSNPHTKFLTIALWGAGVAVLMLSYVTHPRKKK